jgi:ABC-2 type transport system ATP-binding protein
VSDFVADELRHASQKNYRISFDSITDYDRVLTDNGNKEELKIIERDAESNSLVVATDDAYINSVIETLSAYSVCGFTHLKETLEDYFMKYYKEDKDFGGALQK